MRRKHKGINMYGCGCRAEVLLAAAEGCVGRVYHHVPLLRLVVLVKSLDAHPHSIPWFRVYLLAESKTAGVVYLLFVV